MAWSFGFGFVADQAAAMPAVGVTFMASSLLPGA